MNGLIIEGKVYVSEYTDAFPVCPECDLREQCHEAYLASACSKLFPGFTVLRYSQTLTDKLNKQ